MSRITITNLRRAAAHINKLTDSPETYITDVNGVRRCAVGHYYIEVSLGNYALARVVNDGGGIKVILRGGTARELYDQIHAWMVGRESVQVPNGWDRV